MTTVTAVTAPATRSDELSERDYHDIYEELREKMSLDKFIAFVGSTVSKSWWSQYESGVKQLNWERKNELRRATNLRQLAPPAAVAAAAVSESATVYKVGAGDIECVVQIGENVSESLTLHLNGDLHIDYGFATQNPSHVPVTPVTIDSETSPKSRPLCFRPYLRDGALFAALDAQRRAGGLTWDEFLAPLAEAV